MGMARGLEDGLLRFCNGAWRDNDGDVVDIAEVVRCKNCVHMKAKFNARFCEIWCMFNGMGDEGFCNYGERKDGDQS